MYPINNKKSQTEEDKNNTIASVPERLESTSLQWRFPEILTLELPARYSYWGDLNLSQMRSVTVLSGKTRNLNYTKHDPGLQHLLYIAAKILELPDIRKIRSTNYLSRTDSLIGLTHDEGLKFDAEIDQLKSQCHSEILKQGKINTLEKVLTLSNIYEKYGVTNCEGMCEFAIPVAGKMSDAIQIFMKAIVGGDHLFLTLRIKSETTHTEIIFDPWANLIMPATAPVMDYLGTILCENPQIASQNTPKSLLHVPIVAPMNKNQSIQTKISYFSKIKRFIRHKINYPS